VARGLVHERMRSAAAGLLTQSRAARAARRAVSAGGDSVAGTPRSRARAAWRAPPRRRPGRTCQRGRPFEREGSSKPGGPRNSTRSPAEDAGVRRGGRRRGRCARPRAESRPGPKVELHRSTKVGRAGRAASRSAPRPGREPSGRRFAAGPARGARSASAHPRGTRSRSPEGSVPEGMIEVDGCWRPRAGQLAKILDQLPGWRAVARVSMTRAPPIAPIVCPGSTGGRDAGPRPRARGAWDPQPRQPAWIELSPRAPSGPPHVATTKLNWAWSPNAR
jgi:hypothetical protein